MPIIGMTEEEIAQATAEVIASGGSSTDRANRLPGETATEANIRITEAYKAQPQPELTVEGAAAGATIEWVRTAAGGIGKYMEVWPIGAPIPETRTANYGNVYDAKGNLISGTGLKTGSGTKTVISSVLNGNGTTTVTYADGSTAVLNSSTMTPVTGSSIVGSNVSTTLTNPAGPTTNIDVLKAALRGLGFTSAIIDSSSSFLNSLLKEGLDYDNATEVFLNNKTYTLKNGQTINSPFYTEYGYLNEGLTVPKSASELFNTVEGFKGVVDKYKLSSKYLTQDNLKQYVKNDVTVANLAERAATAQLRALEADPFQVNALIKLGYINSATDLTDFYMDPKVGQQQLELNRQTGVFTAEALRRAKAGVATSDTQVAGFKELTASLAAKGYNEAQISQLASQGFENIAQEILPTTKLAQIYEKAGGSVSANTALTEDIQNSLLAEEFKGTASERRKKLAELESRAFQGTSGVMSRRSSSVAGLI